MQVDKSKCVGCGCCMGSCPNQAISYENGQASIDSSKCTNCGTCASVCPLQAISEK